MLAMMDEPKLKQTLRSFQIFFIVFSAIIGGGIFNNNGEALEIAGPAGLILSVVAIGLTTIFVGECISELTQQFPAPNAIVEYVKSFVDEDLGWVVGIAYWYAFASVFAVQNLAAAQLSEYWGLSQTFQTLVFYAISPLAILALNFCGVFYYGLVETAGGALKLVLVFGISIWLCVIAAQNGAAKKDGPINDGFRNKDGYAKNHNQAACFAIPLVAYSFIGIEIVAVTAFEAKFSSSLRWPSRSISGAVFLLYFFCTIAECLTVSWQSDHLPQVFTGDNKSTASPTLPSSTNLVINATFAAGYKSMAGFLNGCLIFSALSASNTSLYVSSRTLYGLARDVPVDNSLRGIFRMLSTVVKKTGVPVPALVFSAVSFFWLPFLQLKAGYAIQDLIEIIAVSSSVSCVIVWAALCIAYIRYEKWLRICDAALRNDVRYERYRRTSENFTSWTVLSSLQPWIAWLGLIGCILVFVFTSATWWSSPANFSKVTVAYAAHVILFALFVLFKIINRRMWVKLDKDPAELGKVLKRLTWLKIDQEPSPYQQLSEQIALQPIPPREVQEEPDQQDAEYPRPAESTPDVSEGSRGGLRRPSHEY